MFRHLPLVDVHEHAELAAEAAEAAAAQGRFWEMHDALFAAQGNLDMHDVVARATDLGLDLGRFVDDIEDRRHALRVARDVSSAADSGAAGTPTFFINGRRHTGGLTLEALDRRRSRPSWTTSPPRPGHRRAEPLAAVRTGFGPVCSRTSPSSRRSP